MRRGTHLAIVALVSLALVPSAALAQASFPTPIDFVFDTAQGGVQLKLPKRITLQPLTVAELLGGSPTSIDMGSWGPGVDPAGSLVPGTVVRTLQDLWEVRIKGALGTIDVQVEVIAEDTTPDALNHATVANQRIYVNALPGAVVQIDGPGNSTTLTGSIQLQMDMSQAGVAGDYAGRLIVTVNQF